MAEKREGRILRSISGFYEVQTSEGLVTCRARGSLRRGDSPLTGDLVEITVEKANKGMGHNYPSIIRCARTATPMALSVENSGLAKTGFRGAIFSRSIPLDATPPEKTTGKPG